MPDTPSKPENPPDKRGTVGEVFTGAKSLSSSPLGIIALFIVLIYGIAALVLSVSVTNLGEAKLILVWFLVGFPVLVFLMFSYLVKEHHWKLYGPSDFTDQKDFVAILARLAKAEKTVDIYKEVANVAVDVSNKPLLTSAEPSPTSAVLTKRKSIKLHYDDPQKGKWGGLSKNTTREIVVGKIEPLKMDSDLFRVPLTVRSTDPKKPVEGKVKFHLHDTFNPDVEVVKPVNGVATLELVSYGAFTVGVETDDGGTLEIDLSSSEIDAPTTFKSR